MSSANIGSSEIQEGFAREKRLNKKEIGRVFSQGKRISSRDYLAIYLKNVYSFSRLGVTLKKKMGNAVVRNYEKRCLKEIFRRLRTRNLLGLDLILMKRTQNSLFFYEKRDQVYHLLKRIQSKVR